MAQSRHYETDLTLEELIKLAQDEATDDGYEALTEVGQFILATKIKPSETTKVQGPLIYWAYCKWCKENKLIPLKRHPFFKEFKKRFNCKQFDNGGPTYWVEPEPFEISKDEWWVMRKAMRNEKQQARKKTQKRRKVSGPES